MKFEHPFLNKCWKNLMNNDYPKGEVPTLIESSFFILDEKLNMMKEQINKIETTLKYFLIQYRKEELGKKAEYGK